MKKNPIYQALSLILRNTGRSLQILRYGLIEHGWLRMTDLEHEIKIFVGDQGSQPLLADVGLLIKVDDLPAAIDAAQIMDVNDFPREITTGQQEVEIQPKVLNGLIDLLPAVSSDDSRGCLKCVFVNRKRKEAVATDGHVLLLKKLSVTPKESFLIDPISLKIAACFGGNFTRLMVCHRAEVKDAQGKVSIPDGVFLILSGDGWQMISRVLSAKDYPMYWKAIPDRSKAISVLWDKKLTAEVSAFLEKSKPFTNPKSHLVHYTAQEGIVRNRDLSYLRSTAFTRDIFALKQEQVIGLDAEIFQTVLRFIQDKPVAVTVGDQMIKPVVFQGEDCLGLIMPLRTGESSSGITRAELMQDCKDRIGLRAEAEKGGAKSQGEMKKAA